MGAAAALVLAFAASIAALLPSAGAAAPHAAMVMDARTGEVIHSRNAETRLHPASLTKMMTLYIAFQAIERGHIRLDDEVTVTREASNEPPSKLGLRAGQKIKLRYLIRAAAVKSANDAATAIGIAIAGSEEAFARQMTATAQSMGMNDTTFRNAHGLTQAGHLSTARDMTVLGRHMIYDFPQYYNLFSRKTADASIATVSHTNSRFLSSYRGADGIKTGFTNAAGFNLVASAERGQERIVATVFGGSSTVARNRKVAELMDLGFAHAPTRANLRRPTPADYAPDGGVLRVADGSAAPGRAAGKIQRPNGLITRSIIPRLRPGHEVPAPVPAAARGIDAALAEATGEAIHEAVAIAVADAMVEPAMGSPDAPAARTPAMGSLGGSKLAPVAAIRPQVRPSTMEFAGMLEQASAPDAVDPPSPEPQS